jgi:ubiquinone biosynthesis protein
MRVPRAFPKLSGPRVATSEYLEGTPFTILLSLVRRGDHARIEALGLDLDKLGENLVRSVLKQIFDRRLFHSDPHPGNLIALADNRVGFVDFGLVDHLDETSLQQMTRYLTAIYSGDVERMYYVLRQFLIPGDHARPEAFHEAFLAETRKMLRERSDGPPRPQGERSPFAQYLVAVVRAGRDNDFRIPQHLLSMYRTLITAESVAQHLGADVHVQEIGRRFFAGLQIRTTARALDPPQVQALAADVLSLAKDGPGLVHRLLSDLADERFLLHVRAVQSTEDRVEANRRARLVASSVLSVALSILLVGGERIPGLSGLPYRIVVGAVFGLNLVYLLLVWRRLG